MFSLLAVYFRHRHNTKHSTHFELTLWYNHKTTAQGLWQTRLSMIQAKLLA